MGRRRVITWLVLFGLLVLAFAGTVVVLNSTLYSANGFVGSYLAALSRHDVDAAVDLATTGDKPGGHPAATARDLLDPRALGELSDIHLVSDTDAGGGTHRVRYGYRASGTAATTTFTVEHTGARLGFFSTWRFTTSPLGVFSITPEHDADFTVNGLAITSARAANTARDYLVLTPGRYVLGHRSTYFTATAVPVVIAHSGGRTSAAVDIQANPAFVKEVQKQLDAYLLKCTAQKVLLPTDCPFGHQISDRIVGLPTWSMSTYPPVTIDPTTTEGTWQMPKTVGQAHLTVKVKSLFDGTMSTFDQDVPFTVSYRITFEPDGSLRIDGQ
jgi:hypothetical protein